MKPAWITGLGAVSCLGRTQDSLWNSVQEERSGIVDGLGRVDPAIQGNRALRFSIQSAREAMNQAGWSELGKDDGLILATTTGLFLQWDWAFTDCLNGKLSVERFRQEFTNQPLGELSRLMGLELGVPGASTLLTSACSASTQALALAQLWLSEGRVKRTLVIGVEVLCDLTLEGFRSLQLLSSQAATPFDTHRKGINLSEGAASLCLDSSSKGALAAVAGFGLSTDAFHMTGPHPEGEGSYRSMKQALRMAGRHANDLTWVHAHGTGSQQNDLAEGLAISRLCGEDAKPWVSSTKWLHGHALAASGALETVLVVRAMQEELILRTRGLENPDRRIPVRHPQSDIQQPIRHVLKNTLGFGGTNASLLLSHPREVKP
jgi:3-oxoacyl-(acyl-carrier-protein) synthase